MASASRFLPLRALLVAGLVASAGAGHAQAYGRFRAADLPSAPGFTFTKDGFRVADSNGSLFRFEAPVSSFQLKTVTDRAAEWTIAGPRPAPIGLRVNSRSPGFELIVRQGFKIRLDTLARPLLSVKGATFDGAPTPRVSWVLVTFRQAEPAVLFSFPGNVSDMRVEGRAGSWTLRLRPAFEGPIRIAAPFGQAPPPGSAPLVERLGDLVAAVERSESIWTQPIPRISKASVVESPGAIDLNWTFDRPGAIIPPAILLAATQAGVQVLSPYRTLAGAFADGPLAVLEGADLRVRLPIRPVPRGRALTQGPWSARSGAPDPESIFVAAAPWAVLAQQREAAMAAYGRAPRTTFPVGGAGIFGGTSDIEWQSLARLALLHARVLNAQSQSSAANLALTACIWARDPWTLLHPGGFQANAETAAAGLFSDSPARRGDGALAAIGVLAARARPSHIRQQALPIEVQEPPAVPPDLAAILGLPSPPPGWARVAAAPLWVSAGPPCWLRRDEKGWILSWRSSGPGLARFILRGVRVVSVAPASDLQSAAMQQLPDGSTAIDARTSSAGLGEVLLVLAEDLGGAVPSTHAVPGQGPG